MKDAGIKGEAGSGQGVDAFTKGWIKIAFWCAYPYTAIDRRVSIPLAALPDPHEPPVRRLTMGSDGFDRSIALRQIDKSDYPCRRSAIRVFAASTIAACPTANSVSPIERRCSGPNSRSDRS
ncbi:hypothetical protein NKI56_35525 [Mesorhizobium sp. M0622]|uniref:hypothetical protein n=1 Tax=Mesorhizobium sp. M0622 TaxID=2956975 RepID=UPI00333A81E7